MQQSYRSPRQPTRTRSKPYTRRQPPPRSGSIMATIRNIVTAPLSWFSTTDEFEDTPGKRRRAPVSQQNLDASDEHRPAKRLKVPSPPPQPKGYLDPPLAMFQPHSKSEGTSQDSTSIAYPSISIEVNTQERQPDKQGRRSLAASVWSRRDQSREVSMDNLPGRFVARDATMIPLPVSREASFSSVPRDSSVGPVRAPFRMRTTLSPIPVGPDHGQNPKRRERDPSEPPPLTALMSNPIFVRPPLNQHPTHRSQSVQPTTTLGALAQTSRAHNRISSRQSSLHLNDPPPNDPPLCPINASEIALSELAIYRTPLLPTRLRGSETIPEMFKPKKVHAVVPMKSGKRDLPRLGTGRKKKKGRKEGDSRKPYSVHGSVKKLVQRRKMEEEAERGRTDHTMDTPDRNADDGSRAPSVAENVITPLPEPEIPQRRTYARETSTLRVGRSRTNRLDRPLTTRPPKTKFSAAFDDDDAMDQREQGVQRSETKPLFEPPKDFTFARDTSPTVDVAPPTSTNEPPISALPFSLIPGTSKPSFPTASNLSASQPAVPLISLSPPTPQKNDSSSGIPNFFANSSFLTRTSLSPTRPPPSGNSFSTPSVREVPHPTPPVKSDQTVYSEIRDPSAAPAPPETTQPIPSPTPPAASASTTPSPAASIFPTTSAKAEVPEPTPALFDGDSLKTPFTAPTPPTSTQPPSSLFGGPLTHNHTPEPTKVSSATPATEHSPAVVSSKLNGPTLSVPPFGSSSEMPFAGFGASNSTEGPKAFIPEQANPTPSPGESTKSPTATQSEGSKETKPGFSFTFKFGAPPTSPEKPTAPQFGDPSQGTSNSGVFTFGTSPSAADPQKSLFGSFPRPVTPPREDEEVRMEESPTRVVEIATPRPNESSFFGGRVLNFGQNSGNTNSPFGFGTVSGDSNSLGSKVEEKPKSSGFTFASSGFDQPSPAFTFGKADDPPQQATSLSPFTFGASKLPEINTFSTSQTTSPSPFNFGQQPGSSQGSSGFTFGQQSPATTTSPFNFGQTQTLAPPSFGQQNGSVPNSPSTFNQPLSFGFGAGTPTSTSNPFNFQSPSPITTTPSSAPGFTFSQQPPTQAQPSTPVSPFLAPGSPQPASGSLFNIGASPTVQSPGTRAIKKLPTRRGGARR